MSLEVVNVWHHVVLCARLQAEHSTCLHCGPYITQTRTQDHMMPYTDYLQADVH
jgi:hypothetical protein